MNFCGYIGLKQPQNLKLDFKYAQAKFSQISLRQVYRFYSGSQILKLYTVYPKNLKNPRYIAARETCFEKPANFNGGL